MCACVQWKLSEHERTTTNSFTVVIFKTLISRYVLLVSGLNVGSSWCDQLSIEMMADYVTGQLGGIRVRPHPMTHIVTTPHGSYCAVSGFKKSCGSLWFVCAVCVY